MIDTHELIDTLDDTVDVLRKITKLSVRLDQLSGIIHDQKHGERSPGISLRNLEREEKQVRLEIHKLFTGAKCMLKVASAAIDAEKFEFQYSVDLETIAESL